MAANYVTLTVQVWDRGSGIHISCDDKRITDENGEYKGLNIAVSKTRQPKTHRYLELLLERELPDR